MTDKLTCPPDPPACEHGVPYYPTGGMSPRCTQCPNGKPSPRLKTTAEAFQELGEACKKLGRECETVLPYWLRPTVLLELLVDIIGRDPKK